jgi:hypothetical protein
MLGGEIGVHRFPDIIVDVARGDGIGLAVLDDPAEQLLPAQILHAFHEPEQRRIAEAHLADFARFRPELERQRPPLHVGVALAKRGRTETLVVLRIGLVADADPGKVEQPHNRRAGLVLAETRPFEVLQDPSAKAGESLTEGGAAVVFPRLLRGAKVRMVAILLPPAIVPTDRLDMAVRIGTEPGIGIGGGQADRVQPVDFVAVGDAFPAGREIAKGTADAAAGDPRHLVIDKGEVRGAQVRHAGSNA